ncbi:AraC family transcriptional regulator ligand-binding domain-containing protein [Halopseudomonas salegens]|uniref:Arabinose-binding domain of AraC transcription regulator, N-term n=1 Tax=Halopseudomonas salegens TaxID=1434072 RepID=A0A1H2I0M8_9GAMM|nr:AraC family transcriptional regulator ligand-binding domain-containing protein [Halopseudomonas salegens]SDU37661.1 Arabinose-binding domain of AraC transcription regulator, N-term [Halopseudomonas salegens]
MTEASIPAPPPAQPISRYHRGPMGRMLEAFLQRPGVDQRDFSLVELGRLWQLAGEVDPAIGLHLFARFTPQDWHIVAYLTLFVDRVETAFRLWRKYGPLVTEAHQVGHVDAEGLMGIELSVDEPDEYAHYLIEHYAVMSLTMLRHATGQRLYPQRVQFRHARPHYAEAYAACFGPSVEFGCEHNRLLFDHATANLPMQGHNQVLTEVICGELDRRLSSRRQLDGWAGKVALHSRKALLEGRVPSLESVASDMHQSSRTLRRRLTDEGINYRAILDHVRADLEQYLELQGLSRAQLAERLGYSETTAYLHARKRWCQD